MDRAVGAWTHSEERMVELHERLVTWWFGSFGRSSEFRGVWDDAFRRFDERLRRVLDEHPTEEERLMETRSDMLLECFEGSLNDHDHILATFPHELPDGWQEWLPAPPED